MLCHVVWYIGTNISKEFVATIFKVEYPEQGGKVFLRKVGTHSPKYKTLRPRGQYPQCPQSHV
jgi:hypothetical protein